MKYNSGGNKPRWVTRGKTLKAADIWSHTHAYLHTNTPTHTHHNKEVHSNNTLEIRDASRDNPGTDYTVRLFNPFYQDRNKQSFQIKFHNPSFMGDTFYFACQFSEHNYLKIFLSLKC